MLKWVIFMKLRKGGIETILVAVILIGVVIGLIMTTVKDVSKTGENTIGQGMDHLASQQIKMNTH